MGAAYGLVSATYVAGSFFGSDLLVSVVISPTMTMSQLMLCKLAWAAHKFLVIPPVPICQGLRPRDESRWLRARNSMGFLHFVLFPCAPLSQGFQPGNRV